MSGDSSNPLLNFVFTTIGKEPALLKRLSAPAPGGQAQDFSPSPSPVSSPRVSASTIPSSTSRQSVLEALEAHEQPMNLTGRQRSAALARELSNPLSSSGATTQEALDGELAPSLNGSMCTSVKMNQNPSTSRAPPTNATESCGPNHSVSDSSALNAFLPVPVLGLPPLSLQSLRSSEQASFRKDDALVTFRHALQRLQMESEEYARREEETRHALARQQEQATRWHVRADALIESLTAIMVQCERRDASASDAVAEAERLRSLVRQHEEEEVECRRKVAVIEAREAELVRTSEKQRSAFEERIRQLESRVEELSRAAAQAKRTEARMLAVQQVLDDAVKAAKEATIAREQELLAQLEEQKRTRTAAQERQELLDQLHEAKRTADLERQRRMKGLERLEGQVRAEASSEGPSAATDSEQAKANSNVTLGLSLGLARAPSLRQSAAGPASLAPQNTSRQPPSHASPASSSTSTESEPGPMTVQNDPRPSHLPDLRPRRTTRASSQATSCTSTVDSHHAKPELHTPALDSDPAGLERRLPNDKTPTNHRAKPETSIVGREPIPDPSSAVEHFGVPPSWNAVKAEESTPPLDRCEHDTGVSGSSADQVLRREQSLDYEASPSRFGGMSPAVPSHGQSNTAMAPSLDHNCTALASSVQEQVASRAQGGGLEGNAHVPSPAVSFGMPTSELSLPRPSIPDLAYPSRTQSPSLAEVSMMLATEPHLRLSDTGRKPRPLLQDRQCRNEEGPPEQLDKPQTIILLRQSQLGGPLTIGPLRMTVLRVIPNRSPLQRGSNGCAKRTNRQKVQRRVVVE
ncbi:hypothetical protein BD414DRAFT_535660 [Trametes punicea]|nr:hypothetical protein BD414DRAFT_535660 [Trametes punicea]